MFSKKKIVVLAFVFLVCIILGSFNLKKKEQVSPDEGGGGKNTEIEESQEGIKIVEGNVCEVDEAGSVTVLVDKKHYKGVERFSGPKVSPDGAKICFLAETVVPIWVYYSNIDGSGVTKVDVGKNCVWSHNSGLFAYNNHTTDVSPVDVYTYEVASEEIVNLTKNFHSEDVFRIYGLPEWSEDDSKVTSPFTKVDLDDFEAETDEISESDLPTGEKADE